MPKSDTSNDNAGGFNRRRLPEKLINPNGVSSAITRRNAFEDGEHFPKSGPSPKSRRVKRSD